MKGSDPHINQACERAYKPGSVDGRLFIWDACRHTPRARNPNARRATAWHSYLRLLQMGFTKPRRCRRAGALLPHRFSFSPGTPGEFSFLWHFPSGHPAQPLAGILPCGARTFLALSHAAARPTRMLHCNLLQCALAKRRSNHKGPHNVRSLKVSLAIYECGVTAWCFPCRFRRTRSEPRTS